MPGKPGEACVERFRGMFAFALWDRGGKPLFGHGPSGREAALLRPARRWAVALRFRAEIAGPTAACAAGNGSWRWRSTSPWATSPSRGPYSVGPRRPPPYLDRAARPSFLRRENTGMCISPTTGCRMAEDRRGTQSAHRRIGAPADDFRGSKPSSLRRGLSGVVAATAARISAGPGQYLFHRFFRTRRSTAEFAKLVADRYKTRHFVDLVESDDFDLIDTLARLYDEPYADSSAIPTYRVCQLAPPCHRRVASGDGGDESSSGLPAVSPASHGRTHA